MKKTFIILTALLTANTAPTATATATTTTMAVPTPVYHARARHVASVAEGMVIEHQYDNHH